MKHRLLALTLCIIFSYTSLQQACATCVGRLEGDVPPFFTQEYDAYFWPDANNQDKNDDTNNESPNLPQPPVKKKKKKS